MLCLIAIIGGAAWIMLVSVFNVAAQEASPMWVRARALGAYLAVYQGGTALGSFLRGAVAARLGEPLAMVLAAGGAVLGLAAGLRWHLADSEKQDLRPWNVSVPKLLVEGQLEEDPTIVQIEYCVAPDVVQDFLGAMQDVSLMRERNGAFGWLLSRNRGDEERHKAAVLLIRVLFRNSFPGVSLIIFYLEVAMKAREVGLLRQFRAYICNFLLIQDV